MSITKKLFSKNFFLVNLVLVGIIIGFVLSTVAFGSNKSMQMKNQALAQTSELANPEVKAQIAQAEAVQGAFNWVSKTVLPSIVELNVTVTKDAPAPSMEDWPWKYFFDSPDAQKTDPQQYRERGLGSGVIVDKRGKTLYILTNNHVTEGASEITITTYNEKEYKGKLVGADKRKDLAIVSFESDDAAIAVAKLGDSNKLSVGDWAIALGNPLGLEFSVTSGIISALHRVGGPGDNISDFIQTDTSINQGNSGGALVNIRGEVIGINTWIASPSGGSIGLGFAIPINNAKKTITDLVENKQIKYGWLGVALFDADAETLTEMNISNKKGALVGHVFVDSPADKSGVLPGDFIKAVDGVQVDDKNTLTRIVGDLPANKESNFTVVRNGKDLVLKVKIGERQENITTDNGKYWPGIEVISLKSELLNKDKLPKKVEGVFIISVLPKTPAAALGLKSGDIITAINEKPVKTLSDFYRLINDASQKELLFKYIREEKEFKTSVYLKK